MTALYDEINNSEEILEEEVISPGYQIVTGALLCRDDQEYKRTVPISGPINPFGQIRISPLIAVSHIGLPLLHRDVRSAAINGQLSTPWTTIDHDCRNTRSVNRRFCISGFCRQSFPGLCIVSRQTIISLLESLDQQQRVSI